MTHRGWAGAALVALALALGLAAAGCAGEDEEAAAGSGIGRSEFQDAMLAYARCMRKYGVDVPDPQPGERAFAIGPGSGPDSGGQREFREADEQCRKHLRDVRPPELSEEERAAFEEAALKHVRCMRRHGIELPDPQAGEGGGIAIPLDSIDLNDPQFREAQKACERYLREGRDALGGGSEP